LYAAAPLRTGFLLHAAVLSFAGGGANAFSRAGSGRREKSDAYGGFGLKYLPETRIINGDKPRHRGKKGSCFYAYGTPWNGKEGRGEKGSAVLKGLCFLEQATVSISNTFGPSAPRTTSLPPLPRRPRKAGMRASKK